jgi:hypothetical protein
MRVCVRALTALLTASMLAGWAAAEPPSHDVLSLTLQRIDGAAPSSRSRRFAETCCCW